MLVVRAALFLGLLCLTSTLGFAKSRAQSCESQPNSPECMALKRDCADDRRLLLLERRYCAQNGLLELPPLSLPPEHFLFSASIRHLQPDLSGDQYTTTLQLTQGVAQYLHSPGVAIGQKITTEIGLLDKFSIDPRIIFLKGKWWNHRLWTAAFTGAGWSYIKGGALPSAGYIPTGLEVIFATSPSLGVVGRSQLDWPLLHNAPERREFGKFYGVGAEARSEVGVSISGFLDILAAHRRFMGRDWFGLTLQAKTGPQAPYQQINVRRCLDDHECSPGEHCSPETYVCTAPTIPTDASVSECADEGLCSPLGGNLFRTRHLAVSDLSCRESRGCKVGGACTMSEGVCVAGSDKDCRRSSGCAQSGLCSASKGVCVDDEGAAPSDADVEEQTSCATGSSCRVFGLCHSHEPYADPLGYKHEPRCEAKTAGDCRSSLACSVRGACGLNTLEDGDSPDDPDVFRWCAPQRDEHCARSMWCSMFGRCVAQDGVCVTSKRP